VALVRKAADEMRTVFCISFETKKINYLIVISNKFTHICNFVGLVTSGLGSNGAHLPSFGPH
jgi:hypothetical protein